MSADVFSLDYTTPARRDLALAIAAMRAHAKTLRRSMMSSTDAAEAVSKLGNVQRIEEAARRLELALPLARNY